LATLIQLKSLMGQRHWSTEALQNVQERAQLTFSSRNGIVITNALIHRPAM
jgi:hypothetical protein